MNLYKKTCIRVVTFLCLIKEIHTIISIFFNYIVAYAYEDLFILHDQ